MANDSGQNRSEKPTPRRRDRARKEGDVAYSSDLTAAAALVGLAMLVDMGGEQWTDGLGRAMAQMIATCSLPEWSPVVTARLGRWLGVQVLVAAGLASLAVMAMTALAGVVQVGFRITTQPLVLNPGRLSLANGWSRLFSMDSVVKALTTLIKMTLITIVAAWAAHQQMDLIGIASQQGFRQSVALGAGVVSRVLWSAAAAALGVGLADYAWQRWRREKRLMMSKTELRQEQKEDGGDPQQRARMRKLQREMTKRRGLKDVASATVILTNPTHYAVAVKYDRSSTGAPRVVAKGSGALARQIVRLAKAAGVPVLERKPLTRALYRSVDIGKEIPSEFYQAVAEILAFLYRQKRAG